MAVLRNNKQAIMETWRSVVWQWTSATVPINICYVFIVFILIAGMIVLSLIPVYLPSRTVTNNQLQTTTIIINYGTNLKDVSSSTVTDFDAIAANFRQKYLLHAVTVDCAEFVQVWTNNAWKRVKVARCLPNGCYNRPITKCQPATRTAGDVFVVVMTIQYQPSCHGSSCHRQLLTDIYSHIESIDQKMSLAITFTDGRTLNVELVFCSFGSLLTDPISSISESTRMKRSSQIHSIKNIDYYIPSYPSASMALHSSELCTVQFDLTPLSVVRGTLTTGTLQTTTNRWLLQDDVISDEFFRTFFLPDLTTNEVISLAADSPALLIAISMSNTTSSFAIDKIVHVRGNITGIANGPYFASSNYTHINFYTVYRLYRDYTNSFMYGIVPSGDGHSYETLHAAVLNDNTPTIAVPSRLYYTVTEAQPLAGMRTAVKDIFDVSGTKTSGGNRAYFELYPAANRSAVAVQRLLDQGAILVGKVKMSQFANGEMATADWVDYQCPFNPRADGYQQPGSSSSGSAAGMAAYAWLDFAIGSDTGGSVREPAALQGLYGARPSHNTISLDGVIPLCAPLDTAGFFARKASSLAAFGTAWYGNRLTSYAKFPTKVLYSTEFFEQPAPAMALFEDFASRLADYIGAQGIRVFNVSSAFEMSNITNQSLDTYYNETYISLIGHYQYYNLGVGFFNDYKLANEGKTPFIDPVPTVRWQYGYLNVTNASYADHLMRKDQLSNWWNNVVQPANSLTCSENLFLYPVSNATASYRNIYLSPAQVPLGFTTVYISPFVGNPDIAVPIGQLPYSSTITMSTEYLPVGIGFMAHVGCDNMLFELLRQLENAGILQSVKTGKMAF